VEAILHRIPLRILQISAGLSAHSRLDMDSQDMCLRAPRVGGSLPLCHMLAEEMPSQFGYGLDVDAFGGIGCTVKHNTVLSLPPLLKACVQN